MKTNFLPRKPRKYIGQYQPRLADGLKKAAGRAIYLDDVCQASRLPGMLVAKALFLQNKDHNQFLNSFRQE